MFAKKQRLTSWWLDDTMVYQVVPEEAPFEAPFGWLLRKAVVAQGSGCARRGWCHPAHPSAHKCETSTAMTIKYLVPK